jgi:hypothetical protein
VALGLFAAPCSARSGSIFCGAIIWVNFYEIINSGQPG